MGIMNLFSMFDSV